MKLFLFKCLIVMRLLIRIFKTLLKAITFFYRHMDNYPILIKISSFIFQRANQNKTWFYYKPSKWSETLDMQLIRKGTLFFLTLPRFVAFRSDWYWILLQNTFHYCTYCTQSTFFLFLTYRANSHFSSITDPTL